MWLLKFLHWLFPKPKRNYYQVLMDERIKKHNSDMDLINARIKLARKEK